MKRQSTKRSVPNAQAPTLALILVDGAAVRRKLKRDYDKVVRDLNKAREELERFEKRDVPQFNRWVSKQFGALMTEIRETAQRVTECDLKLLEMEREVLFTGASPGRAYQRVMNRYRAAEKEKQTDSEDEQEQKHSARDGHGGERFEQEDPFFHRPPKSGKKMGVGARLKELYRALVRRLHPDTQKEMTAKKLEWWHQAQAAYEKRDAQQLEVILALCEIDEAGSTEKASLSVLQRITAQFKHSLRELRRALKKHQCDLAWEFSTRKDLTQLAETLRKKMTRDLERMRRELELMEEQMSLWAAQSKRSPRRVYYRRRVVDPLDSFF